MKSVPTANIEDLSLDFGDSFIRFTFILIAASKYFNDDGFYAIIEAIKEMGSIHRLLIGTSSLNELY